VSTVLFSPIGTADPITGLGDGPMLHIVRHYHPEAVVLFLSPLMASYEKLDQRFSEVIRGLSPDTKIEIVESPIDAVHQYDLFIPAFLTEINNIAKKHPDSEILLNVSSGTPAMQSALIAINSFGVPDTKAIQVATPRGGVNEPQDREKHATYELELMWEANDDNNDETRPNRCREVGSAAFGVLLQRENIRRLINAYDYKAAKELLGQAHLPQKTNELITGAMYRIRHNLVKAEPYFAGTPYRLQSQSDYLREAISALVPLIHQASLADFVRSLTPVVSEVVKTQPEVNAKIFPDNFYDQYSLLDPENKEKIKPFERLHRKVRNYAAHDIKEISVTPDDIKDASGFTPWQLLETLRAFTDADLELYDKINAEIVRQIDGAPLHL
jgi:CRISPR type III-A/MTUBE-associated protein Csm6